MAARQNEALPPGTHKERELGTLEHFRVTLQDLGFHYNVAISARYAHHDAHSTLTPPLVYRALHQAISRHPALAVQVLPQISPDARPVFIRLDSIDLRKIVTFVDRSDHGDDLDEEQADRELDDVLSEQNSLPFDDPALPLWRVVVLKGSDLATDLIFVWHHVIGDGRSGNVFHHAVLDALNTERGAEQGAAVTPAQYIVRTSSKPLNPALESLLTLKQSLATHLSHAINPYLPSFLLPAPPPHKWSGAPYHLPAGSPQTRTRTHIRHITVPYPTIKALVSQCHSQKTSITAFLQSVIGRTLLRYFPDAGSLRCAVAISVRRFFAPEQARLGDKGHEMGLWISAFHLPYNRADLLGPRSSEDEEMKTKDVLWSSARKNHDRIEEEIRRGDTDIEMGLLGWIPDFKANLLGKIGKKRDDSFAVTNLGVVDFTCRATTPHAESSKQLSAGSNTTATEADRPWSISKLVFSQSCHVQGSSIQFCLLSLKDGDLVVSLSWQDGTVTVDEAEAVGKQLKHTLVDLGADALKANAASAH